MNLKSFGSFTDIFGENVVFFTIEENKNAGDKIDGIYILYSSIHLFYPYVQYSVSQPLLQFDYLEILVSSIPLCLW
jgi:hypothetical protein